MANGVLLIAEIIFLKETRGAKILYERAKKMRYVPPSSPLPLQPFLRSTS
jgi:hypothetical protein